MWICTSCVVKVASVAWVRFGLGFGLGLGLGLGFGFGFGLAPLLGVQRAEQQVELHGHQRILEHVAMALGHLDVLDHRDHLAEQGWG